VKVARVLCPTDLSEASAHAAEWAVAVAGHYKAAITALHVVSPILMAVPGVATSIYGDSIEESETDDLRKNVAAQFGGASADRGVVDVLIDVGQPASRILDRAASLPADLIVMGTHGTSGFQHLVLGSVTEKVLRKATGPVLTVPPRAHATSRLPFRRVLCAIDFSEASLAALQFAASLVQESGAVLTLLHVLEWPWEEPPPPMIEELPFEQGFALAKFRRYSEETAQKRLESLIPDSLRVSHAPVVRLRSGKPYVQILQVAAEEKTDVIVIGVHGRNPLDLALFGSTTNQVVRRAVCPVLTRRQ
jgi:nucleotide-binding universal stress UspA family protein